MGRRRMEAEVDRMLEIKDLHVHYGVIPALKGISLHIEEGEVVSMIGANGAGKTTTLHTISGLKRPTSGQVTFQGQDITKTPAQNIARLGICQIPEGRGVFNNLTVVENLYLGAYLRKDKAGIEADAEWAYSVFPRLRERQKQRAGTLSGGELQMLAMARAMMSRPKLLLMDEPSMGLSPILVDEIFRTIIKLNRERGGHHPAGGAKRPDGPVCIQPGLCNGDRGDHHLWLRPGPSPQRRDQKGLPGDLSPDHMDATPTGPLPRGPIRALRNQPPRQPAPQRQPVAFLSLCTKRRRQYTLPPQLVEKLA